MSDDKRRLPFDRKFLPAVEEGLLTETEAASRGNREAYAQRLVSCHGMAIDQAYDIADNRRRLVDVMKSAARQARTSREKEEHESVVKEILAQNLPQAPRESTTNRLLLMTSVMLLVALLGGAWLIYDSGKTPYNQAKKIVERFERGLDPRLINYEDPIYDDALAMLATIHQRSRYFDRGQTLADQIHMNLEEFRARREASVVEQVAKRQQIDDRRAGFRAARQRAKLNTVHSHPECEH